LRLTPSYRGRPGILSRGYTLIGSLRRETDLPFDVTSIVADNLVARRVLGAGLRRLPRYQELEPFTTLVVPVWHRQRTLRRADGPGIRRARIDDIDDVAACLARNRQRYQFAPCWTTADLLSPERSRGLAPSDFFLAIRGGRITGCLALWNQNTFKQIVVRGYGPGMRWRRAAFDMAARLCRLPRLPAPGQPVGHAFISHVAIDDDRAEDLQALFDAAYEHARTCGHRCVIVGFASRHPFVNTLRRAYRTLSYSSILYTVQWDTRSAFSLDGRMPHLEVGLL
jgi:hypothetical protein